MRIEPASHFSNASRQLPLSEKVHHCANRYAKASRSRVASLDEALDAVAVAAEHMELASAAVVRTMHSRNSQIFRLIGTGESADSLVAYLPLNYTGVDKLINGGFQGRSPSPEWIATPDEQPAAIYIWLIWAPGRLARAVPSMLTLVDELSAQGCPIFSRAINWHAERLNQSIGFEPALRSYPTAPDWLLVLHPKPLAPKLSVEIVRSFDDMAQIYAVRSATYMAEQFCLYSEEFDGNDFCATQFIGRVDGDAAGCIRLRYFHDFVKVERLAVRREYRRSKLAYRLVRTALNHAKDKGFSQFYGHSRADLLRFWQVFGFKPMADRPEFRFADVDYREIMLSLDAEKPLIGLGSNPLHTIRPEGDWEKPGPLELSNLRPANRFGAPAIRRLGE